MTEADAAGSQWEAPADPRRLGWRVALVLLAAGAALFLLWWRLSEAFFAGNARSILWVHVLTLGLAVAIVLVVGWSGKSRGRATGVLGAGIVVMGLATLAVPLGLVPPEWCCLDLDQERRPADWQAGVELAAFRGSKAHDADESFSLAPPADAAIAMPVRCVAYQEGRHHRLDECTVVPGNASVGGFEWGPWTLQASWSGWGERLHEDVELHPERRTVVAFDAEGRPVAWWAGGMAENGRFSTQ